MALPLQSENKYVDTYVYACGHTHIKPQSTRRVPGTQAAILFDMILTTTIRGAAF